MYLIKLYKEIRTWLKIKNILQEYERELVLENFRIDWIGRAYTVINLPEEVANHQIPVQEGYVLGHLRNYDSLFMKMGISDYLIPEFQKIENTDSFLLILAPEREALTIRRGLLFLAQCFGLIVLGRILYKVINNNFDTISNFISSCLEWLF